MKKIDKGKEIIREDCAEYEICRKYVAEDLLCEWCNSYKSTRDHSELGNENKKVKIILKHETYEVAGVHKVEFPDEL